MRHFAVRSPEQLRSKVLSGWLAYVAHGLAEGLPDEGLGWRRKAIYEFIIEQGLTTDDVARVSANYAQDRDLLEPLRPEELIEDPIEFAVETRIPNSPKDPMKAFAREADAVVQIARQLVATNAALRSELDLAHKRLHVEARGPSGPQAEAGNVMATVDEVLWSRSWRITAPLRRLGILARRRP